MTLTPEMEEILQYLCTKDDYALFAGFAAYLHTGVEPSPDIDVFVSSYNDVKKVTEDFIKKGWTLKRTNDFMSTVEKNGTTFDIIFSENAQKVFLPSKVMVSFQGNPLYTTNVEALLVTKMNQVASPKRSEEKTKRDREVIRVLQKKIDVQKLRKLFQTLEDSFWTEGYF